jgi:hypothetical protein
MTVRGAARALLVLNLLYCAWALVEPRLPGWKMFDSAEPLAWRLVDRDGRELSVDAALPRGACILSYADLRGVVRWLCERERSRAPLRFTERSRGIDVVLGVDSCEVPP